MDELPPDIRALERVIGSSSIILSTLSTLSNPGLDEKGMFRLAPVERLVIDEASQIKIFDYMVRIDFLSNLRRQFTRKWIIVYIAPVPQVSRRIAEGLLLRGPQAA